MSCVVSRAGKTTTLRMLFGLAEPSAGLSGCWPGFIVENLLFAFVPSIGRLTPGQAKTRSWD